MLRKSKDKVLEEFTGDDGESWFWTYHNAGEEIEKIMIQKCIKVANLASIWDLLTDDVKRLNKEQDKYGDKLVKKAEQRRNLNDVQRHKDQDQHPIS